MQVAQEIGRIKKQKSVAVLQRDRWQEIMQRAIEKGQKLDLSEKFIQRLFKAIHQESIEKQERILKRD